MSQPPTPSPSLYPLLQLGDLEDAAPGDKVRSVSITVSTLMIPCEGAADPAPGGHHPEPGGAGAGAAGEAGHSGHPGQPRRHRGGRRQRRVLGDVGLVSRYRKLYYRYWNEN